MCQVFRDANSEFAHEADFKVTEQDWVELEVLRSSLENGFENVRKWKMTDKNAIASD